MDIKTLRHDVLRNIGCILSGTELLSSKKDQLDSRSSQIVTEMNLELQKTLSLLEDLFNKIDSKTTQQKGRE